MSEQSEPLSIGLFWRNLRRQRMGCLGLCLLISVTLMAVFAPQLAPYDPQMPSVHMTIDRVYARPSPQHWLGTDDLGKDVLSNFIFSARISLLVGLLASVISIGIGGAVGIVAGFYGARVETVLMRITDIVLVIPYLPLAIVLIAITKPSLVNIVIVIGILSWTGTARLVRSQVLSLKERKFVLRARALGAGNTYIIAHHILALVLPVILANTILVIAGAILSESTLAFLGLGDPTALTWGKMMNIAFKRGAMSVGAWWVLAAPGLGIIWVVLGSALLGRGLEQIMNPGLEFHHLCVGRLMVKAVAGRSSDIIAQNNSAILDVRDLSVHFLKVDHPPAQVVDNVSFTLRKGETLGLVGESGCGKTTLVLSLMRLLPATGQVTNGQIIFEGRDLLQLSERDAANVRGKNIALVPQGAMNALNPVRTIGDQIAEAIVRHNQIGNKKVLAERVSHLLELVSIEPSRENQYPHQYSGGMRQRAMIAMALACDPQILIADEPTTALDVILQAQILDLLAKLREQLGLSVILVTHDLNVVAEVCDAVVVMYSGGVAEYSDVETIFNHPRHPYTQQLLLTLPNLTQPAEKLVAIPGHPPQPDALPLGCRFASRCPAVFGRCHDEKPALHNIDEYHRASCHLVEPK